MNKKTFQTKLEKKTKNDYFGIGDVDVLTDLGGDRGAEFGDGNDVVEVVDFHDGG